MTPSAYNPPVAAESKSFAAGYVFGAPVKDLGWFASLIMGLATGMMAFFLATFLGIVGILVWRGMGHPAADFTISYRLVGLPVGGVAMVGALGYLGIFWVKRIMRKA